MTFFFVSQSKTASELPPKLPVVTHFPSGETATEAGHGPYSQGDGDSPLHRFYAPQVTPLPAAEFFPARLRSVSVQQHLRRGQGCSWLSCFVARGPKSAA